MRVRVKGDHDQFYALVYGRLPGRSHVPFWRPSVVGAGVTTGAAIKDAGGLVAALEDSARPRVVQRVRAALRSVSVEEEANE